MAEKLTERKIQNKQIRENSEYNTENNPVIADRNGHVPYWSYIRRYKASIAKAAEVPVIPPKNLRTTHVSLMTIYIRKNKYQINDLPNFAQFCPIDCLILLFPNNKKGLQLSL